MFEGKNRFVTVRKDSHNCALQINYVILGKAEPVVIILLLVLERSPLK